MHIFSAKTQTVSPTFYWKSWTIITIGFKLSISLAKMLVSNDPRPISRTNIVKICVRHISTCFLIIQFHISGEYSSENSFVSPEKLWKTKLDLYNTVRTNCEKNILSVLDHPNMEVSYNCFAQKSFFLLLRP
jgi:hypothetical protein